MAATKPNPPPITPLESRNQALTASDDLAAKGTSAQAPEDSQQTSSSPTRRVAVLVLGMHRSGTSALTRMINLLGADLPSHLMAPLEGNNEAGFWESMDAYLLNEEILTSGGSRWDDWRRFNPDWMRSSVKDRFKARAIEILEKDFAASSLFVLKDPRICRLLPFWLEVLREFDTRAVCVLPIRNPLEVAASLKRRDGFPPPKSHMIWLRHVLDAERDSRALPRVFITYDELLDNWRHSARVLGDGLGIAWPRFSATAEIEIDEFLKDRHRHHTEGDGRVLDDPDLAAWVKTTFATLNELRAQPNSKTGQARLDQVRAEFDCASDALGAVLRHEEVAREALLTGASAQSEQLNQVIVERDQQIAALQRDAAIRDDQIRSIDQALHERNLQIIALNEAVQRRDEQIRSIDQALHERNLDVQQRDKQIGMLTHTASKLNEQIGPLNTELANRGLQIAALHQHLSERDREIAALTASLAHRDHEIARRDDRIDLLNQAARDADARLAELFASTSWRVTAPMRGVRTSLSRVLHPGSRKQHPTLALDTGNPGAFLPLPEPASVSETMEDAGTHDQPGEASAAAYDDPDFDEAFYLSVYPDVAAAGIDAFEHYTNWGRQTGRLNRPPEPSVFGDLSDLDPKKETVLVVSHEASRTGAPILVLTLARRLRERHNVIALLLGGGPLILDFKTHCDVVIEPFERSLDPAIVNWSLQKLLGAARLSYAIVNSVESRAVLPLLAQLFVPTVALIHEFASYTRPRHAVPLSVLWASEVVFSAAVVAEDAQRECEALVRHPPLILQQGRPDIPAPAISSEGYANERARVAALFRPASVPDDAVIVLGAGTVQLRKGVDLFLACAKSVRQLAPQKAFRFIWVGHGFDPDHDAGYSVYLQDQLTRAGLQDVVSFVGELEHIERAYELADILLLSSRLDPLPNVAIDAMSYQIPIVCFDQTTGIADALRGGGLEADCVAPYLDVEHAARLLVRLIDDQCHRLRIGEASKELGSKLFDMESYVAAIERLGARAAKAQEQERRDCRTIEQCSGLRMDYHPHPTWPKMSYPDSVRAFVRSWASGVGLRKPFPGFHPGIYENVNRLRAAHRDPLAHFLEAGRPSGPWLSEVISPSRHEIRVPRSLRVALHIHAYYPELVSEILEPIAKQGLGVDLLISVPTPTAAEWVDSAASDLGLPLTSLAVVPNRGRDIGPLLTEYGERLRDYDVIGHLHTKKTVDLEDSSVGQTWFHFLIENLVGGEHPMGSEILARMETDPNVGLVFPDDPNVMGWTANKPEADLLAERLGLRDLPEDHFNFPMGTMFWARVEALLPLLNLNLHWEDYPKEPLPYDGTMLHALERLLPFVARTAGYRTLVTNVPGLTR